MTFDELPIGTEFVNDRELELFETGCGAILTKVSATEYSHNFFSGTGYTGDYGDYANSIGNTVYPVLPEEEPV